MALPRIAPYALPAESDLPSPNVPWRPDPRRAALLVHDLQNHFLDAFDRTAEPVPRLLANVSALLATCRRAGVPVIYTAQPGAQTPRQRGLQLDFWGEGVDADPRSAAVADEVAPAPGDVQLTKWRYSAFARTTLDRELADRGRDQLVICGIYGHIGVLTSAVEAFMRDVQPFVVGDAVADFSPEWHRQALEWAAARCAVPISTRAMVEALAPTSVPTSVQAPA